MVVLLVAVLVGGASVVVSGCVGAIGGIGCRACVGDVVGGIGKLFGGPGNVFESSAGIVLKKVACWGF